VAEVQSDIERSVLAVLFILTLIGSTIRILRPFLGAIVWATTVVVATWPFMISLQAVLWNKRSLAVVVMSLLLLCVLVVPLSFAIAAIVSNLDDIAVWAKNLATFKLAPPPVWLASLPLVGAKAVELWDRIAAAGIQDATVRVAAICGWRD
jgi:predicted PurR-regulated permease PerM